MSEHLTQNQIEAYGRRKLSVAELLSVSGHITSCEACRLQVESELDGDAAFFAIKSGVFPEAAEMFSSTVSRTHLTLEQTAEYIDGAMAGEELQVLRDHLTGCEQCAMAVDDLRIFRQQVAPELSLEYRPSLVRVTTRSRWNRLLTYLSSFSPQSPVQVFGWAMAALLITVAGLLVWQALQRRDAKQVITVTPSPTVTPLVLPIPAPDGGAATVIAQLNDGEGQVTLDREGKLSGIGNLSPAYQRMVKEALANQEIEKSPLLAGLTPGTLIMRGGNNPESKFLMIEPIGKVLLSDRPTFRWSRPDRTTEYVVEVYDEKFNLITSSAQIIDNSWTTSQSLKRGGIYSWQVKVIKDGQEFIYPRPPAPQAKFRILDHAKASELIQARRAFASSHLTLALLYAQAGLLDEAERELRILQKANRDSAIARRLLAHVQAMRR